MLLTYVMQAKKFKHSQELYIPQTQKRLLMNANFMSQFWLLSFSLGETQ